MLLWYTRPPQGVRLQAAHTGVHDTRIPYDPKIFTQQSFPALIQGEVQNHRGHTLYHSVHKSKVLEMHPSDAAYDIIWGSYVSVKFAQRVNTLRSYGMLQDKAEVLYQVGTL